MKSYPRIRDIEKRRGGICCICKKPKSDRLAWVQINWFRGDDESLEFHRMCFPDLKRHEIINKLLEIYNEALT